MNHLYEYTGPKHPYYINGHAYGIVIQQTRWLKRIKVRMEKSYPGEKIVEGSELEYKDLAAFRRQWRRK